MTTDAPAPPAEGLTAEHTAIETACRHLVAGGWSLDINAADSRALMQIIDAERARAEAAERERDQWSQRERETQAALQAIGEEFGVYGGEPRTDGVRRVLTEQRAARETAERRVRELEVALTRIAAIEPASNCDAGSMARSRMRDIARAALAGRGA